MLTHQNERPEKCPIKTCDYHIKGFARTYDKNRHTLTHYKGTMVCGFCPGSGTPSEKSFNRADVFKRHLTSVHGAEWTPPNSRKRTVGHLKNKKLSGYGSGATGKCSTCSGIFENAQDFFEHLDDCVLRIVQQEEPSESTNARRLADVQQDRPLDATLPNKASSMSTSSAVTNENKAKEESENDNNNDLTQLSQESVPESRHRSREITQRGRGVTLSTKGRKKRKDYPLSWGTPSPEMKMKKRVLCVFDGPRRLWKDDMMLDTEYEVRVKLSDGKSYVTDLDVQTMRRADAFHDSTEEEKGPWHIVDPADIDSVKLMEVGS